MMLQIIFFAVVTLVIAYRLYTELGNKNGTEDQHAQDWQPHPLESQEEEQRPAPGPRPVEDAPQLDDSVRSGLQSLQSKDPAFDLPTFVGGAKAAFEMVLNAFSQGDRETLKSLLAKDVYQNFEQAIASREADGHQLETSLVGYKDVTVSDIELENTTAFITLRFVTEQGFVLRDKDGGILESSGAQIDEVVDIWTLARDLKSSDPNWTLIATDSEEA